MSFQFKQFSVSHEFSSMKVGTDAVLLGVFIVDSSFTLVGRMRAGLVWYHAHCSHAYQHAARNYASHGKVVVAVGVINIVWLLPLAWLTILYPEAGLPITVAAWMPLVLLGRFCKLQQVQNPTVETEFKNANDARNLIKSEAEYLQKMNLG
jgi:hypothetical protein